MGTTYNAFVRYLGVDPGGKRIGLALGDDVTGVAVPLAVLDCHGAKQAVQLIIRAAERHAAERIVIGFPTREDGSPTAACVRSEAIATSLRENGLTVVGQSEFLSSNEARRRAREAGFPAGRAVDHFAAQVLLEEYLASHGGG